MERREHWERLYATRPEDDLGWFEADPAVSLDLVRRAVEDGARSVIDVGGGA